MGAERHLKPPVKTALQVYPAAHFAALNRFPAADILGLVNSPSFAILANLAKIHHLTDSYRLPSVLQARAISGISETIATFASQRATFEALAVVRTAQYTVLGEQMRQIISAQDSIVKLLSGLQYRPAVSGLLDSVNRYGQVQAHLAELTIRHSSVELLRGYTALPSWRYDRYLDGLPARPIARRAAVARQAGDAQSGLIIAESLTARGLGVDDREELAEVFTATAIEPWQAGPVQARSDLFDVLTSLEPGLADWLKAAWDDIARDGPKAASKIANCTVECIDRALRAAAPTDEVCTWLATIPPKPSYLHDGRPTRSARVMYIMRTRSRRDAALVNAQVEALTSMIQALANDLQAVKHGEAPSITVMRGCVLAAESALSLLLLHF